MCGLIGPVIVLRSEGAIKNEGFPLDENALFQFFAAVKRERKKRHSSFGTGRNEGRFASGERRSKNEALPYRAFPTSGYGLDMIKLSG